MGQFPCVLDLDGRMDKEDVRQNHVSRNISIVWSFVDSKLLIRLTNINCGRVGVDFIRG